MKLLDEVITDFSYPTEFMEIVNRGLINLEPWIIIDGENLYIRFEGIRKRFPQRKLIPFAQRVDNDDIACWEEGFGRKVFIVHDFAMPGWERRQEYDDFWMWLKQAVDDMIEYVEYDIEKT